MLVSAVSKECTFDNDRCCFVAATYYAAVTKPVIDQLRKDPTSSGWHAWVQKWSKLSVLEFLRSTLASILHMERFSVEADGGDLESLNDLLPWHEEAITAYKKYTYTPQLDTSLVENLREDLGEWWKCNMHTFEKGLEMLPWAFVENENHDGVNLSENIQFGVTVHTLEYGPEYVKAVCFNETTREDLVFEADAVIVTLPLNIVRQMNFKPPIPPKLSDAIDGVFYSPSTKIMLQCKTKFWEESGIVGGFSRTDKPIGQIHYPSHTTSQRGILLCYTWKQEALLFGSQTLENAISEAVDEIATIHPEIRQNFECGAVQAWYNDNTAQGAFCYLKPYQYNNSMRLLLQPHKNIYFAGEAISWANGWIQGAIESGLRASYQFFDDNENLFVHNDTV